MMDMDDIEQRVGDLLVRMDVIKRGCDPHMTAYKITRMMEEDFATLYASRIRDTFLGRFADRDHCHDE